MLIKKKKKGTPSHKFLTNLWEWKKTFDAKSLWILLFEVEALKLAQNKQLYQDGPWQNLCKEAPSNFKILCTSKRISLQEYTRLKFIQIYVIQCFRALLMWFIFLKGRKIMWVDLIRHEKKNKWIKTDKRVVLRKQMTEMESWLYSPQLSNSNNLRWLAKVKIKKDLCVPKTFENKYESALWHNIRNFYFFFVLASFYMNFLCSW